MNITKSQKIRTCLIYLLLFLSSLILIILFNGDSPLYFFNTAPDNTVYKAVAKRMLQGDVLYRDIYEHKGLYLYFYYMIKEFITPWIVELLLDFCYVFFAYKTLRIFQTPHYAFIYTLFINVIDKSLGYLYHFGGQPETIGKAILMIIIYMILKNYYIFKSDNIKVWLCFLTGILTMILFMIKYTMTAFVLAFAITLCIKYFKNKRLNELLKCFIIFTSGFAVGFLPGLIYFFATNSFGHFIKIYLFDVSFKYEPSKVNIWPIVLIILLILFTAFAKKKESKPIDMLTVSCLSAFVFTSVATRSYYFGVCMPFIAVAFIALDPVCKEAQRSLDNCEWQGKLLAGLLYIGLLIALPLGFRADMGFMTEEVFANVIEDCDGSLKDVVDIVNASDDKSLITRSDNCIVHLMTGTLPDTKYFINYNMVLEKHNTAYAISKYREKKNYVNDAFNQYIDEGSHEFILQYACNYMNFNLYKKVGTFCSNGNYGKTEIFVLYRRK